MHIPVWPGPTQAGPFFIEDRRMKKWIEEGEGDC